MYKDGFIDFVFLQLLLTNNKCIKMNLRYSLNRQ